MLLSPRVAHSPLPGELVSRKGLSPPFTVPHSHLSSRPPQHHRIEPTRDELAVPQFRLQLPLLHDHFAPQDRHHRPARHLPAFPGTVPGLFMKK